jgi:hypothetical protein
MKRFGFLILIMIIMTSGLQAQKTMDVKTDLFSAFLRTFVLKYEMAINEDMSVQLGFFYTGFKPRDADGSLTGFGITPEFRYYLSETPAPNGLYLAPNYRFMKLSIVENTTNENATIGVNSFAINLGKQLLLKDVIIIDFWIGPSYNFRTVTETSIQNLGVPDADGFGLRAGIAIGIAF